MVTCQQRSVFSLTEPDIASSINKQSQFMHKPTTTHWIIAKCILRHLKGIMDHGLFLCRHLPLKLHAFSYGNWAENKNGYTSTNRYIVFHRCNPISWSSKKQNYVAYSTTEAQNRAAVSTTIELSWIQSLLQELSIFTL